MQLNDRYNKMVLHVNTFTTAYLTEENTYTASALPLSFTTLGMENFITGKNEVSLYPSPARNEVFIDLKTSGMASVFDAKYFW